MLFITIAGDINKGRMHIFLDNIHTVAFSSIKSCGLFFFSFEMGKHLNEQYAHMILGPSNSLSRLYSFTNEMDMVLKTVPFREKMHY